MEENRKHRPCPSNWGVRFLCDCGKENKSIIIHQVIARQISTHAASLLSDHPVCQQKIIALQLMIPSLNKGAPHIANEGKFLTRIEFLHFEENGQQELEKNLHRHFDTGLFA
jgi:hypothetical protein